MLPRLFRRRLSALPVLLLCGCTCHGCLATLWSSCHAVTLPCSPVWLSCSPDLLQISCPLPGLPHNVSCTTLFGLLTLARLSWQQYVSCCLLLYNQSRMAVREQPSPAHITKAAVVASTSCCLAVGYCTWPKVLEPVHECSLPCSSISLPPCLLGALHGAQGGEFAAWELASC